MELQYDENLLENKFFRHLQKEFSHVLEAAPTEKWIICVPRTNSFAEEALASEEFVLAHILGHNDELPESHFQNFNGKSVKLANKSLIFTISTIQVQIAILFEEIFYTKNLQKYRVWCIETSLSDEFINPGIHNNNYHTCLQHGRPATLHNMEQALQFCYAEIRTKSSLQKIETAVKNFIKNNSDFPVTDLQRVKTKTQLLYDHCLDICLTNRRVSDQFQADVIFAKNLRVAVEYYMMNLGGLYAHLFDGISLCCEEDSQLFNKSLMGLTDLTLAEFEIDAKFTKIVPEMKAELVKIEQYQVAAEKLDCLKRAFDLVSQKFAGQTSDEVVQQPSLILTIDELLPIFIYAIIKSDQAHWFTTLQFLKHFSLHNTQAQPDQYFGAENFLITTLEATVMYILDFRSPMVARLTFPVAAHQEPGVFDDKESYLNYLFHHVQANDEEMLAHLLRQQQVDSGGSWSRDLCHPLCDCSECAVKIAHSRATANSKNAHKLTAMHVTAIAGHAKLVTLLLSFGAKVNVRDLRNYTPLHYAAQNGHQNTLLLLLHAKASINARTDENWTPLQLACGRGHESCAKAILYFADHMNIQLDVNAVGENGRTALHLAAKWGFQGIVEALLEYGAKTNIPDKANNLPVDYAHNNRISKLLIDHATASMVEETHTREQLNQFVFTVDSFSRIDKLSAAISIGDNNLACYYLGIEPNPPKLMDDAKDPNGSTCHPLCACERCNNNSPPTSTDDEEEIPVDAANQHLNINVRNSDSMTPLHLAAFHGNADFLRILLDHGADPNVKTKTGKTCLHLAVEHGKWAASKQLLKTPNADLIDVKDSLGDTALHYAVKRNNSKLVELILSYEPNLNLRNLFGKRPIDLAKKSLQLSIVRMLQIADAMQTKIDSSND